MIKVLAAVAFCFALVFGVDNELNLDKNQTVASQMTQTGDDVNLTPNYHGLQELNSNDTNLSDANLNMSKDHPARPHIDLSFNSLFINAHIVVKIVVGILILFSIITWTIFIVKFSEFKIAFYRLKKDEAVIKTTSNLKNLNFPKNSFARYFINEIEDESSKSVKFSENMKSRVKQRFELKKTAFAGAMKERVAVLASIGSSAPFIGLFGTVWGIMNSFVGIANSDNASLSVVAPGIAEALFATALGLAAAIPAVLIYNYLVRTAVNFNSRLARLSAEIYLIFDRNVDGYER